MKTDEHCNFCDCAQGRWPCTCMPRSHLERVAEAVAFDALLNPPAGIYAETGERAEERPGYWERLATDRAKLFALKCAEFDALNARLQIYRAVAVIGWAGFILTLLGV